MNKRFWGWLTSVPSLVSDSEVTNEEQLLLENKVNSVQGKVLINDGTPGETTKAYQNITTYPDGSMGILQKNLTTGEISFQGINSSGQRVFETSLTPHEANTLIGANSSSKMLVGNGAVSQSVISRVSYQTGNNSLVLYDKTPVPVATNGALVPPLTTNKALATVPLVTNGTVSQVASKVGQVQNNRLPYKPVLALPNYLSKPEQGGIMVVGAGTKPISGAYNIDINPKVGSVHYGDATNLVNVPTGSQAKVIIENPYGFEPLNPEILRVVKPGGEIIITGTEKNKFFRKMFKKNKGENGELIVDIKKIPPEYEVIESRKLIGSEKKQGYQSNGTPIQTKTDRVIILKKK